MMPPTTGLTGANKCDAVTTTIAGAIEFSGLSRSALYKLLATGKNKAVKNGKRTLVVVDTLKFYLQNLPVARFNSEDARHRAIRAMCQRP